VPNAWNAPPVLLVAECHQLDIELDMKLAIKRRGGRCLLSYPVGREDHGTERNRAKFSDGDSAGDGPNRVRRKVSLRIPNVADNMLIVTLPVRSVLLPGSKIGRGSEAEVREELTAKRAQSAPGKEMWSAREGGPGGDGYST
jgi:hypothetical protein